PSWSPSTAHGYRHDLQYAREPPGSAALLSASAGGQPEDRGSARRSRDPPAPCSDPRNPARLPRSPGLLSGSLAVVPRPGRQAGGADHPGHYGTPLPSAAPGFPRRPALLSTEPGPVGGDWGGCRTLGPPEGPGGNLLEPGSLRGRRRRIRTGPPDRRGRTGSGRASSG